jgi:hypothetical protein
MVSTLVPIAIISGIYVLIFLILRRSQRRYYAPRTYLGSLREAYVLPHAEDWRAVKRVHVIGDE